jgi:mono/diheme cytochrome c family protein
LEVPKAAQLAPPEKVTEAYGVKYEPGVSVRKWLMDRVDGGGLIVDLLRSMVIENGSVESVPGIDVEPAEYPDTTVEECSLVGKSFPDFNVTGILRQTWVDGKMKEMEANADDPSKTWVLEELVARGEKVYAANCAACHQPSGKGMGPIKALDGSAIVLDSDHTQLISIMLNGAGNGAMPAWKQLSDTEIAAVMTYTKNQWGNQTGQAVQPSAIVAARQ